MDPTTVTTTAVDPWSTAAQWNAVLNAPLAFALALLPVSLVIWKAFEWAYRMRLDKANHLFQLNTADNEMMQKRVAELQKLLADKEAESKRTKPEDTAADKEEDTSGDGKEVRTEAPLKTREAELLREIERLSGQMAANSAAGVASTASFVVETGLGPKRSDRLKITLD
jgi:hypothetical protein